MVISRASLQCSAESCSYSGLDLQALELRGLDLQLYKKQDPLERLASESLGLKPLAFFKWLLGPVGCSCPAGDNPRPLMKAPSTAEMTFRTACAPSCMHICVQKILCMYLD